MAFQRRNVAVVGISADSAQDSRKLASELKIPFPLLSDTKRNVISMYGVADARAPIAVPCVVLIDREGAIVWKQIGEWVFSRPSAHDLLEVIDTTLQE